MARFRRKRSRSGGFKKSRRSYSRKSSGGGSPMQSAIVGGVYGAARPYVASALAPVTNMLPLGQYSDEVALGGTAFLVGMLMPRMKTYTNKIVTIEAARIGELASGGATKAGSGASTSMALLG